MTLELTFLDVGNADCIVILPPEHGALVIDVPRSGYLRRWLQQRHINHIESIYITHRSLIFLGTKWKFYPT